MSTVNNSFSIPSEEYRQLEEVRAECEKLVEKPNMTEIVRVAIYNLITEKNPKDISTTLNSIGRKRRGRPRKDDKSDEEEESDKTADTDFSQISDFQWEKIESLFSGDREARTLVSDILFDMQNTHKRNVVRKRSTAKVKRWRRLQKWQESGVWTKVYQRMLATFDKQQVNAWNEIFLKSFLVKRKRNKETSAK